MWYTISAFVGVQYSLNLQNARYKNKNKPKVMDCILIRGEGKRLDNLIQVSKIRV
jgi:hypothetical protein